MIEELFQRFDGAFSENTIRAYRADFNDYQTWCDACSLEPAPATAEQLADYIDSMAGDRSVATIMRRIASLGSIFRLLGQPDTTKEADCVLALKRVRRKFSNAQKQATPLTGDLLVQLQATCDTTIVGRRDRVLLQLGYETLRRRSELVRFRFDDLVKTPARTYRLLLRRSKTDQFGQGKQLPISPQLVTLIHDWQSRVAEYTDYIVPRIDRAGKVLNSPLPDSHVNLILQSRQSDAGIELDRPLSGHSFRVGGALDLLKRGVPMEKIMLRGGWKTESTALRYLREWVGDDVLVWDHVS